MAEHLASLCRFRKEPKSIPDAMGIWVKRLEAADEILIIDRNKDGELCHFYFPFRPLGVADAGTWYGPLALVDKDCV